MQVHTLSLPETQRITSNNQVPTELVTVKAMCLCQGVVTKTRSNYLLRAVRSPSSPHRTDSAVVVRV